MREFINLVESISDHWRMDMAVRAFENNIDWDGGDGDTVMHHLAHTADIDADDIDMAEMTASPEFKEWFQSWAAERIQAAYDEISHHIEAGENGTFRCYRMITAPRGWKPTDRDHLGQYWSWSKHRADAHWGSSDNGHVKWLLTADIPESSIDWETTLAANASLSTGDECEINIRPRAPVHLVDAQIVK